MTWFDILKEIEIDESALHAQEFAEENCCANIWKSIAQEQRGVFNRLEQSSLWNDRKTTEGCRRLVEWLREGEKSEYVQETKQGKGYDAKIHRYIPGWNFKRTAPRLSGREWEEKIHNQKKGWLQDYVDCRNLKDGGNRPPLEMY